MDLRQLRYFKEIVEQGSISKAAEALHMAQPPLSMLLKQLEEQYGMPLIKRYRQKWEVTPAGKMLYQHANQMLYQMEMFDAKMNYMIQGEMGQLRLGVSSSCLHLIGDITRRFTQMYPQVSVQVIKGDSEKIQQLLYENEVDVVVILAPENNDQYEELSLPASPFALAVPQKWASQFKVDMNSIQTLSQFPFISLEAMEGYSMLEKIMYHFNRLDVTLNIVTKCKDISVAQYLVAKEVGISILPKVQLGYMDEIHFVDLPNFDIAIQPKLLYSKEAMYSPLCRNFIALVEESYC